MIIENVWNLTFDTTTNVVDVYIFGRGQKVESLKSAIVGLGIQRVSDIAMSCGVLNMMPGQTGGIDPVVFWEHSLGCALVCRNFARKISYLDPGKAYLAGLLHDIGVIVNLWVLPKEFPCMRPSWQFWDLPIARAAVCWPNDGNSPTISARSSHFTTAPTSRRNMPD